MSWRGEEGGIKAASHGHDVVMAPNQRVYFDHYQSEPTANEPLAIGGLTTLASVYAYDPMPEALSEKHRQHVLGGQGQIWTEYMPTMDHVEYMGFPRICALAEVLWLEQESKDYADFRQRLQSHRERLDYLGVNAHPE